MNMKRWILMALLLAWSIPTGLAHAQDAELDQLQQQFKERYPALQRLKTEGQVGETWKGYVAMVVVGAPADDVVEAENKDRARLYEILAAKENTTADKVAKRNAIRNFEKARAGEFLQGEDGTWTRKDG